MNEGLRCRSSGGITLAADTTSVVVRALGVIGKVSVATGSARNLHRLAAPAAALDSGAIATSPAYTTDALLRSLRGFDFVRDNSSFTNSGNLRVSISGAGEDGGLVLAVVAYHQYNPDDA